MYVKYSCSNSPLVEVLLRTSPTSAVLSVCAPALDVEAEPDTDTFSLLSNNTENIIILLWSVVGNVESVQTSLQLVIPHN